MRELECHCLISASDDVESVGGIDAFMSLELNSPVTLETSSALGSPCRSNSTLSYDITFTIGERGPDRYPPLYGVHTDFDVEIGDKILVERRPGLPIPISIFVEEQISTAPGDPNRFRITTSTGVEVGDTITVTVNIGFFSVYSYYVVVATGDDIIIESGSGYNEPVSVGVSYAGTLDTTSPYDTYTVESLHPTIDGKIYIRFTSPTERSGPTYTCGQEVTGILERLACFDVLPFINLELNNDLTLETSADIEDHLSAEVAVVELIQTSSTIEDGVTVDYSVSQGLESIAEIDSDFLDKFHGDFPEYFDLLNYSNSQKLYPSGDAIVDEFVGNDGEFDNLYSYIEEGMFIGKYTTHNEYSELVADDIQTYITPYTNHTEGEYELKFYLDEFTLKPLDTRLLLRLSAPINNIESELAPRYTLSDIKFEDPDGSLVVQYEDLVFFGDASDDRHTGMFKNFTTFSLKPKTNVVAEKYQWQKGYPDLQQKYGYTLSFSVLVESLDDAFDDGFTVGFTDHIRDGDLLSIQPTNNLRISAIEIFSSGFPGIGPSPENYLPLIMKKPEKGRRLERKIFPKLIPKKGFDTGIFPESGNLLWVDHNDTYSNIDECDNAKLISYITDNNNSTYITTHETVNDSGKLILKFGTGYSPVSEVIPGAFNWAFDQSLNGIWTSPTFSDGRFFPRGEFDTENTILLNQADDIYHDIDSISLSVTAKKAAEARDFFLDVVGYSDDCVLHVTSPVGGFLQHASGTSYFTPVATSGFAKIDDLGIDGEAISDKFAYYQNAPTNDHYELTTHPLVNSEEFRTYELPLKIFQDEVELGLPRDYNWSTFFENLYLDIFPLPSGASISNIHLIVRYKPQNAFMLSTQGGDIGRIQDGRTEGGFFPSSMASGDNYLNAGSGYHPMSLISGVPHQYRSPETLKTNYSRRWRGIKGLTYGPFNVNQFGFDFFNPQLDTPLIDCLIDFSQSSDNEDIYHSRATPISTPISLDLSSAPLEHYQNIGLRFKNESMFSTLLPSYSSDYMTADWTALSNGVSNFQNHELYGQIFDGYDNVVRLGKSNSLRFNDVDASSGIVLYSRFIPDANVLASDFEFSRIMSVDQGPSDISLQVGFLDGYLFASGVNDSGPNRLISDTLPYSGYQYPLSVLVTYNEKYDQKLRLYTDNELHKGEFINLRAESDEIELTNLIKGISFGELGDSLGLPMLMAEIGYTTPFTGSGSHIVSSNPDRNLKEITATEFFENQRMKFFDPEESYENDTYKLWDYINEDSYHDWAIGAFRSPAFSAAFDGLTKRTNRDLILFQLKNDGVPYVNRTDLTLPANVDSGVSYHSQIENDFVRFHLSDASDNFYAVYPRIRKNLPRGYGFAERALVVETILTNETSGNITWDRCTTGPKLIVSLYTKNQEPYWNPENYGLINRSIHYIEHCPSSIIKIESTFNYKDLCDDSEKWAFFPPEQTVKEFGERLFSDDIDDMFLQYDIVYPSSDGYMSKLQIHTAHVKAEDAFIAPTPSSGLLNFYTSGVLGVESGVVNLFMDAVSGTVRESGFPLFVSGQIALPYDDQVNLFTSGNIRIAESLPLIYRGSGVASGTLPLYTTGAVYVKESGDLGLFTHGKAIVNSEILRDSLGNPISGPLGMGMTVANIPRVGENANGTVTLNILSPVSQDLAVGSVDYNGMIYGAGSFWNLIRSDYFSLTVFNDHLAGNTSASPFNNSINLFSAGKANLASNFRNTDMPLFIDGSQIRFTNKQLPLFLQARDVTPGDTSGILPLTVYNVHGDIPSLGGGFNWDGYDYGVPIEARDNRYSRLSLDNEIRGVNTVGYGVCEDE